ncbi:MAG: hypothetical protein K2P14_03480 [Anaeroplasmataceae bacterium]|jgi:serine O-acetyltransferase|nr:hypothetical protein [Anaeroplasmataceae bacterium]
MQLSLPKDELKTYMRTQLSSIFPDKYIMEGADVDTAFELGLERLENCFKYLTFPAYCNDEGQTFFSHLHADQYAQFLYYFSNSLWKVSENKPICDKLIYLNRILNNFFFSYKGNLPDIFFLGHPVGTILGNAVYNDFLVVFQNVTVNTSADQDGNPAPILGKGLFLGAGAKIIGNQAIGDRVSISVDTVVYNQAIPNDKVVRTDAEGKILIKDREKPQCMAQNYFRVSIE